MKKLKIKILTNYDLFYLNKMSIDNFNGDIEIIIMKKRQR